MRRLLFTAAATAAAAAFEFVPAPGGGYGVRVSGWQTLQPLWVETVFTNGSAAWTEGAWAHVDGASGAASGSLQTPSGAVLSFTDSLTDAAEDGSGAGFRLRRTVAVLARGNGGEHGFSTRFALAAPGALAGAPRSLFMPGVAYSNASALPPGALAGDPLAPHILVREDRLPLPCALAYFAGAGAARFVHVAPDGGTLPDEDFTARVIDARLQFGSIGYLNGPKSFSLAFQFPGSEGDRTYVWKPADGWANRSHPLQAGVPHAYTLDFRWDANASSSYGAAVTRAWRAEFAAAAPRLPAPTPTPQQLYRDGMELLAAVSVSYSGVPSVPFEAALPTGVVVDTSSQMGFVGRALPAAALLLYDAVVAAPNATRRAQAEALVDLWAAEAPTACGAVRTWYNVGGAGGRITWRPADAYQGSLRIQCDGMAGMLAAWTVVPQRTDWLAAATRFADFLVRVQAPDGSIGAAYDWACAPLAGDTRQTPQAVPFLVAAYAATRDERYAAAALAAGAYAATLFADGFSYSGGAVDNPDVPDREAGWLAAQAFLALHELTDNSSWLAPAAQAAAYTETFVYAWSVPLPCTQTPPTVYPCRRSTLGASLIATGQSGADNYMSIAHFDYKRIAQLTGDAHFARFGAFLEATTSQVVDWDGSLGYAARGLMNEATTLSVRRGAGVADWLPWLTVNLLQPIVQEMEAARAAQGR